MHESRMSSLDSVAGAAVLQSAAFGRLDILGAFLDNCHTMQWSCSALVNLKSQGLVAELPGRVESSEQRLNRQPQARQNPQ